MRTAFQENEGGGQSACLSHDKILEDGWSVKVEHTLAGFHSNVRGRVSSWQKCESGEDDDGGNALQRVHDSACSSQGCRNRCAGAGPERLCMQSRQRVLHQHRDTSVMCQSTAPHRKKWETEERSNLLLNLSQQPPATEQRKTGREAIFPQTWTAVAAAPEPQTAQLARGQKRTSETHGTGQVRLQAQRRRATAPSAHEGAQSSDTLAAQVGKTS